MFTSTHSQALLPLCNIPLIEYTLEFLAAGGVKEIIVATKSHADKIQEYLKCVSGHAVPNPLLDQMNSQSEQRSLLSFSEGLARCALGSLIVNVHWATGGHDGPGEVWR